LCYFFFKDQLTGGLFAIRFFNSPYFLAGFRLPLPGFVLFKARGARDGWPEFQLLHPFFVPGFTGMAVSTKIESL
jgi:hypothetical protein